MYLILFLIFDFELSRHHGEGNHTLQERRESKAKRASTPRPRTWDLLNAMNRGPSEDRGRTTTFKKKGMQRTTRAESSGTCKMMLYNVRIDLNYMAPLGATMANPAGGAGEGRGHVKGIPTAGSFRLNLIRKRYAAAQIGPVAKKKGADRASRITEKT